MVYFKTKKILTTVFAAAAALCLSFTAAAQEPKTLVPVGQAVGISVKTQGLLVSELSEISGPEGACAPARDAGIRPGDVIVAVDGEEVDSAAALSSALERCGETVTVTLRREGEERQLTVRPFRDGDGACLGVWVRDGLTGIGTVTYYDPESGAFGALGHPIADSVTGLTVPLREGEILPATVTGVTKSRSGAPGQLGGTFDYSGCLGKIRKNCGMGIFGSATDPWSYGAIPVAEADEVKPGEATILSDASGTRREYRAEIVRVYAHSTDGRDMMIRVTDPELLKLTGGIVQGMSGSPVIQNGKLVGAVTHVLINSPEKGYGIFIRHMTEAQ